MKETDYITIHLNKADFEQPEKIDDEYCKQAIESILGSPSP